MWQTSAATSKELMDATTLPTAFLLIIYFKINNLKKIIDFKGKKIFM